MHAAANPCPVPQPAPHQYHQNDIVMFLQTIARGYSIMQYGTHILYSKVCVVLCQIKFTKEARLCMEWLLFLTYKLLLRCNAHVNALVNVPSELPTHPQCEAWQQFVKRPPARSQSAIAINATHAALRLQTCDLAWLRSERSLSTRSRRGRSLILSHGDES